jgi:DNA-binding beta-propeller fold protein YncE
MKATTHFFLLTALLLGTLVATGSARAADEPAAVYQLADKLAVGGAGGFDYITIDAAGKTLYVPRSSHTLVLDAATGRTIADIEGSNRNHGVALAPDFGRGFISNGGDGTVTIFDLKTNAVLGNVKAAADADCIIYDPASKLVLAFCGDAGCVVPIGADPKVDRDLPASIDLGGKPEYAVADGKGKVFVNIQSKDQVAVIDTKTLKVLTRWPVAPGSKPTGMSMDREKGRLYVGCRNKKMIVMSADDGTVLADLPIGDRVDATAFDRGCALASCGDGTLTVIRETAPGTFAVVQTLKTVTGARTMVVDSNTGTAYLPAKEDAFEIVVAKRAP